MTRLLRDVSAGIRVLQVRDGVLLSEKQILERARNIVMGLVGNYRIQTLEAADNHERAAQPRHEEAGGSGATSDEVTDGPDHSA